MNYLIILALTTLSIFSQAQSSGGGGTIGPRPMSQAPDMIQDQLNPLTGDILIKIPGTIIDFEYFHPSSERSLVKEIITDIKDNAISEHNFIKASSVLDGLNKNRFKAIDLWTDESSLNIELSGPSAGGGL